MSVGRLDEECRNKIRKTQVITKISDVVRELVDNAIDGDAHSVQILLENFGLRKIEVKDNGAGIPHESIPTLFQGGYTSKLENDSHLSCGEQYGFRGEALSAICSFSGIVVTSKRQEDTSAKKFVLDKWGKVTAENVVPCGNGTVVIVRDMFKDYPVRNKHCSEPKVARAQLKEIEFYLKCLGICNPSVYLALYHNGNLIWSKPAVKSTEQALTTVLGIGLAKNLSSCLSGDIFPEPGERMWKGSLNLFVPKKPVDMKNMGFTSSKMTMIFVNRRLVVVEEYQNLIKRYAVGSADRPTQQEQRKFPVAVFMIDVPATEVDFNRDMNKSKMFLTCRDAVLSRLEDMLKSYYGVNLSVIGRGDADSDSEEINTTTDSVQESVDNSRTESHNSVDVSDENSSVQLLSMPLSTPEKRKEHIAAFLGNMSGSSSVSSPKKAEAFSERIIKAPNVPSKQSETIPLSNFTISFDDLLDSQGTSEKVLEVTSNCGTGKGSANNTNIDSWKSYPAKDSDAPSVPNTTGDHFQGFTGPDSGAALHGNVAWTPPRFSPAPVSLRGSTKMFENDPRTPQCGALLHTAATPDSNRGERLSLRRTPVNEPFSKRSRPSLDSSDDVLPLESSEPAAKKYRQVTLEDLRRRDSPKPLRNVLTGSPRRQLIPMNTFDRQLSSDKESPLTCDKLHRSDSVTPGKRRSKGDHNNDAESFIPDLNSSSVLGLNTSISLHESATWLNQSRKSFSAEKSTHVIAAIGDTETYIVKIEGLLGAFNPSKLLEIIPHLRKELGAAYPLNETSLEAVGFLLQEFNARIEEIDPDSAQAIFYIFVDLQKPENAL